MAKTKISEFDVDPSNNTDINSINIAEGCAPSGINNAIRQLMSDLKEQQTGASGDDFTVGGDLTVDGTSTFTGVATFANAPVITTGGGIIPTGGIIIWSGAANAIPSGWLLCNGSNGTPDLRNRFVVGAGSTYSVGDTGGSADATLPTHTHSITVASRSLTGTFAARRSSSASTNIIGRNNISGIVSNDEGGGAEVARAPDLLISEARADVYTINATHDHTATAESSGTSATNANLPPYYALCYIMKS